MPGPASGPVEFRVSQGAVLSEMPDGRMARREQLFIEVFSNDPKRVVDALQKFAPELARVVSREIATLIRARDPELARGWPDLSDRTKADYRRQGRDPYPWGDGVAQRLADFLDGTRQEVNRLPDGSTQITQSFGWRLRQTDQTGQGSKGEGRALSDNQAGLPPQQGLGPDRNAPHPARPLSLTDQALRSVERALSNWADQNAGALLAHENPAPILSGKEQDRSLWVDY